MAEISRAGVKDHGVVTKLLIDIARLEDWHPEVDRDRWDGIIAQLLDSDRWLFLLAHEEDEPVGLAVANWSITLKGGRDQGRMMALIVEEGSRRRGVGTRLMEETLGAARRRGCRAFEVSAETADESVAAFYRRFGSFQEKTLFEWPCAESE
ncbi:MAG TPA: GNAT family N-acetyltransferase [Candidatus Anoxymicrobiaceae bacterium]